MRPDNPEPKYLSNLSQGGRGHWAVYYTSPQSFLFIGSTTLGTFIEF